MTGKLCSIAYSKFSTAKSQAKREEFSCFSGGIIDARCFFEKILRTSRLQQCIYYVAYFIKGRLMIERHQEKTCRGEPSLIVLTGFRATGKTVVGRMLADLLDYHFIDTDEEICSRLGCTITESVDRNGWQSFRDCEQEVLLALKGEKRTVAATGGGSVLHQQAWQQLHSRAFVIWLRADAATLAARLTADNKTVLQRPSITGQEVQTELPTLLDEREPLYRIGSDIALETAAGTPDELAATVFQHLALISLRMKLVH
jgi:shikimate kinase